MEIGDWVHACYRGEKLTGFVVALEWDTVLVESTIPRKFGLVKIQPEALIPGDSTIWLDDLPTMIDLSLAVGDREWFLKWIKEMAAWKPAVNIESF